MAEPEILQKLRDQFKAEISLTGSRATVNPPPMDTDEDWLVFVPTVSSNVISTLMEFLSQENYEWEGDSAHYQNALANSFTSFRKHPVNLIVTTNAVFKDKHLLATALCKQLNLPSKPDRIAVFQAILYSVPPDKISPKKNAT